MKSLVSFLSLIPDHRRAQGQRVPFYSFLEMIILAGMSGQFGIRPVSRFIQHNSTFFEHRYNLHHGVPKGSSVQNFVSSLDYNQLNQALYEWTKQYLSSDAWLSIDGKAIGSTVTDKFGKLQNFKSMVTIFCTDKQIVVNTKSIESKKANEEACARDLIKQLEIRGVTFTMDALHCKKKQPKRSWSQEMITYYK